MCLYSCFGLHKHSDDWDAPPPAATKPPHARSPHPAPRSGYGAPQVTYNVNGVHQTAAAAGAEALHKAANDVRKLPAAAAHAAEALHKAANDVRKLPAAAHAAEALKQPVARVVGEAAGHGAHRYQYSYYEREPVHREDAMDYHYSTATATTDHERY